MVEPPTLDYRAADARRERPSRAATAMLALSALLSPPVYLLGVLVYIEAAGRPPPWEALMNAPKLCTALAGVAMFVAVVCGFRRRRGALRAGLAGAALLLDTAFMWWLVVEAINGV